MTDYTHWHVGMKVVCVAYSSVPYASAVAARGVTFPEIQKIYTIRQIGVGSDGIVYIRLAEIVNPKISWPGFRRGEPRFGANLFRPLVTRPTDISIFTAMLHHKHGRLPVEADT